MFDKDNFFAVDPGKGYFAWVMVIDTRVVRCGVWRDSACESHMGKGFPMSLVIETQRYMPRRGVPVQDVIDLARGAGKIEGQFVDHRVRRREPLQFKKPKKGE